MLQVVSKAEPFEAVQYICTEDRWSNTVNVVLLSGLVFGESIRHFQIKNDPHCKYGLFIECSSGRFLLWPGDWIVKEAGGVLQVYTPKKFSAKFSIL